ncbi:cytochrome P450 4C1-like [Macrosteles quadrilineatus]|uniref:cytochrome P450 4C1-like n=1 Tax=Macrosteles quadrilineatus TaxID=74068 RepID=UPI0023E29025|nr:cytochrome P450 4C1-like [Macrosteles quadrilineatus]
MCELFAEYFSSVYSHASLDELPVPSFDTPFTISECAISLEDINKKLLHLDPTKGSGPDNITPRVLKFCHSELGSHLGPFLFSIFINDIKKVIKVPFLLFADDIKLLVEVASHHDCQSLQDALDYLFGWCLSNDMAVNPTKTKLITFSRKLNTVLADYSLDGNRVERCNTIKDLGVLIDYSFEFGAHINQICTRASRMLGLVFRSARHGLSNHACIILYKSLILQLLEYASLDETARGRLVTLLWSGFLFCLCWVAAALQGWIRVFLRVQQLPGPRSHPLYGNAKEYLSRHRFFQYAAKWRDEFPAFHKTFILFHPMIIVQLPDAVQAVLSRKHKHNEKGLIYHGLKPLLGEGLITSKGERWHSHRKLITPTFHFNILESFVDVFVARTQDFMMELNNSVKENEEKFIDISPYTRKLTLDFICETAMGTPADTNTYEHTEIVNAMHRLEEIGIYRMVRPWLLSDFIFRFTVKGKEEEKYKKILHQFTDQVIQMRRQALAKQQYSEDIINSDTRKRAIFMDLLIASSEGGKLLSDQDIREEVNTFMFAGQNTTQLAINYCLYLLGENPEIQDKAHEELLNIFGDSDRQPTMEDLKSMKYLENCIKDALRLFPSVPVIARKLTEDEVFGKYTLPKGSDVLVLPYVLHRDSSQFPNPECFNPDNFLPEAVKTRHPYSYIPFSAGPRNCIGQKFAVLAEKTVLSAILRKYQVQSLHSRQELIVVPNTVLVPKTGIKLKLTLRKVC